MLTVLLFIVILGLLVFVHELGHFLAARKSGMKVMEFGFGFPPRAFGFYKDPKTKKRKFVWGKGKSGLKKTIAGEEAVEEYPSILYSLNWLPLGGFVQIKGESGDRADEPDSFGYQSALKRIITLFAGVAMNFLFAAVLLGIGFIIGLPADISTLEDSRAIVVGEPSVVIQQVVSDSPAELSGIKFGDKVTHVDGVEITGSEQVQNLIGEQSGQEFEMRVDREGEGELSFSVTPYLEEDRSKIGVYLIDAAVVRFPWYISFYKGFIAACVGVVNIVVLFYVLIKNLIIGQGLAFDVSGPVGIAVFVGQSARLGINYLISTTAMISLSLAVLNILPIPALDGGRIVFILIEKVTRKKVPMKYEQLAHMIGFLLLMLMVVLVTWKDIVGLF